MNAGMVENDPFLACGRRGEALNDCLVIDAHGHLGAMCASPCLDSSSDSVVRVMDRIGVDRIYLSGCPGLWGQARCGNDIVRDGMVRHPERICGYMTVDIGLPTTILPEMQRCLEFGFSGIKIWSMGFRPGLPYDHPHYQAVFDFANVHGLPLLAHTWGAELDQLEASFQKYDRIQWILAHAGAVEVEKYVHVAQTYESVYLETCFSRCPKGLIAYLVEHVPLDKIIWGSDQPFLNAAHQIGRVLFSSITPEQKRSILGLNAAQIFQKD